MEKTKIELNKPIVSFGKEKSFIELKEPTGEQFELVEVPFTFKSDGGFDIDGKKMIQMIESLADLPAGTLKTMPYKEVMNISMKIMDFFV